MATTADLDRERFWQEHLEFAKRAAGHYGASASTADDIAATAIARTFEAFGHDLIDMDEALVRGILVKQTRQAIRAARRRSWYDGQGRKEFGGLVEDSHERVDNNGLVEQVLVNLSETEMQMLELLDAGLKPRAVADRLGVTLSAVHRSQARLREKIIQRASRVEIGQDLPNPCIRFRTQLSRSRHLRVPKPLREHYTTCTECAAVADTRQDRLSATVPRSRLLGIIPTPILLAGVKVAQWVHRHPIKTTAVTLVVSSVAVASVVAPHHVSPKPRLTITTTTVAQAAPPPPSGTTSTTTSTTVPAPPPPAPAPVAVAPAAPTSTTVVTTPTYRDAISTSWSTPSNSPGQSFTLTATVTGGPTAPSGTVVWTVNGAAVASCSPTPSCSSTWTPSVAGTYTVSAVFTASNSNYSRVSSQMNVVVR